MAHKSNQELNKELSEAKKQIEVGGIYAHFKNPQNLYKVIDLGIQEATNKICVIYRAEYAKEFLFVRDLDVWLEMVEVEGIQVPRFKLVNSRQDD